jgi:hypothetical protein
MKVSQAFLAFEEYGLTVELTIQICLQSGGNRAGHGSAVHNT